MVGIDDEAFGDGAKEGRKNRQVRPLPRHLNEDVSKSEDDGERHYCGITEAGDPPARHKGVQIRVVGVFGEKAMKLQRADAEGQVERHLRAENMSPKPAEAPFIV